MTSAKDIILGQLKRGQYLIETFTADFTDAEYFKPPVEGGNHVAWILGHLACTEDWAASVATKSPQRIPEATRAIFKPGNPCLPDASKYPARKELDELFKNSRANLVEKLIMADVTTWDQPSPDDAPKGLMPTMAEVWSINAVHQFWHFGQLTVCRQALQKKKLLGF